LALIRLAYRAHAAATASSPAANPSSGSTVKTHVSRVLTKLAGLERFQAVVLAYESG
jgi:hypothetical protein